MKTPENSTLLTLKETAKKLRLCETTAGILLRDGIVPAVRAGHQWRVRSEDLDAFLKSGRGQPRKAKDAQPTS